MDDAELGLPAGGPVRCRTLDEAADYYLRARGQDGEDMQLRQDLASWMDEPGSDFWWTEAGRLMLFAVRYENPDEGIYVWVSRVLAEAELIHPDNERAKADLIERIRKTVPNGDAWLSSPNRWLGNVAPVEMLELKRDRERVEVVLWNTKGKLDDAVPDAVR